MKTKKHELKIWPHLFKQVIDGTKPFEYRRNDRMFEPGDKLVLQEWSPPVSENLQGHYTGRVAWVIVKQIWSSNEIPGLPADFVIMSII